MVIERIERPVDRLVEVASMREYGMTYADIAKHLDVSINRCREMYMRYLRTETLLGYIPNDWAALYALIIEHTGATRLYINKLERMRMHYKCSIADICDEFLTKYGIRSDTAHNIILTIRDYVVSCENFSDIIN
jgi:hypothetical protein